MLQHIWKNLQGNPLDLRNFHKCCPVPQVPCRIWSPKFKAWQMWGVGHSAVRKGGTTTVLGIGFLHQNWAILKEKTREHDDSWNLGVAYFQANHDLRLKPVTQFMDRNSIRPGVSWMSSWAWIWDHVARLVGWDGWAGSTVETMISHDIPF